MKNEKNYLRIRILLILHFFSSNNCGALRKESYVYSSLPIIHVLYIPNLRIIMSYILSFLKFNNKLGLKFTFF